MLKTLLYNAITYMIEDSFGMSDEGLTGEELCEEIANYLGTTADRLEELGVLDRNEICESLEKEKEEY